MQISCVLNLLSTNIFALYMQIALKGGPILVYFYLRCAWVKTGIKKVLAGKLDLVFQGVKVIYKNEVLLF